MVRPRTRKDRTLDWEQPETLTRRAFFGRRWVTTRTVMVLDAMGYGARQARNSMEYEWLVILSRSDLGHIMVLTEGVEIRIEGIDLVFV